MSAIIIDGKQISLEECGAIAAQVERMKQVGRPPKLRVIIVGEDPGSLVYVRNKERACTEVGMFSEVVRMPEQTTQQELLDEVRRANEDASVHGLLVQMPLPPHIDAKLVQLCVSPDKDVDCLHPMNAGKLLLGQPDFLPCTPNGCIVLLKRAGVRLSGAHAVVVGRSNIVGKPIAQLLLMENCTVTICHSRTRDLPAITRQADILIAAVGKARMITGEMIKPGAAVIDVGINPSGVTKTGKRKICGDVDFDSAAQVAGYITPVPGGVGPMTITMLLLNTLKAAQLHG